MRKFVKLLILIIIVFNLSSNYIYAKQVRKILVDNFESMSGKNEFGAYWYDFYDKDELFAKTDPITGKVWVSTATSFVTRTSTGGIMSFDNTDGAKTFQQCDWNGNGLFDVWSTLIPTPDPKEQTPFQFWPGGVPGSKFCLRIEWDFTPSETKSPFVGVGSNLADPGSNKYDVYADSISVKNLSEYTAFAFWIRVSSGVNSVTFAVSYKHGPGAHGETPYCVRIPIPATEQAKWVYKVIRFDDFYLPDAFDSSKWVENSKYGKKFNEFSFALPVKLPGYDKLKGFSFEIEGKRNWGFDGDPLPQQNVFVENTRASGWLELDNIYLVNIDTTGWTSVNQDTDVDGYTDYVEYAFGSDPNNAKLYPALDSDLNGTPDAEDTLIIRDIQFTQNPFTVSNGTGIKYTLSKNPAAGGKIRIKIFDLRGILILTKDEDLVSDSGTSNWDGKDISGNSVLPGMYIVALELSEGGDKKVTTIIARKY